VELLGFLAAADVVLLVLESGGADLGATELPKLDSELLPKSEVDDDVFVWWVPLVSCVLFRYVWPGSGWAG
jgi:hypothetical protein